MSIVSRNGIKVDEYEIKLKNNLKFYYGDTLNLSFSISTKTISQICSYQITDGTLLLDKDKINAYMIIENKEIVGTLVEDNCVIFRLEPRHQTIGISRLQIILKERTESGEVDILHTPPFNIEIREPLAYTGDAPPPDIPNGYAIVNKAIVNESLIAEATPFTWNLGEDLEYEMTVWVGGDIITDEKLNKIEMQLLKYANALNEHEAILQELLYVPISIATLSLSTAPAELGETVTGLQLTWSINKTPIEVSLDVIILDVNDNSYVCPDNITTNRTFRLSVADDRNTIEKSASIRFLNGKYYGVSSSTTYDNDFILSLSKQLTSDGKGSFSVSSGVGEYIYFATPSRFATPRFSVGGLEGGFALVHTLDFTNASGYMESYNIYKSDNSNLGFVTVDVG